MLGRLLILCSLMLMPFVYAKAAKTNGVTFSTGQSNISKISLYAGAPCKPPEWMKLPPNSKTIIVPGMTNCPKNTRVKINTARYGRKGLRVNCEKSADMHRLVCEVPEYVKTQKYPKGVKLDPPPIRTLLCMHEVGVWVENQNNIWTCHK